MGEAIEAGDVFKHIETGVNVDVVCTGMMKVEEGPWYNSVTYRNPSGNSPETTFTRSMSAFREKFLPHRAVGT